MAENTGININVTGADGVKRLEDRIEQLTRSLGQQMLSAQKLEKANADLQRKYDTLATSSNTVAEKSGKLTQAYTKETTSANTLGGAYDKLQAEHKALLISYGALETNLTNLGNQYNGLKGKLAQVNSEKKKSADASRHLDGAVRGLAGGVGKLWLAYGSLVPMLAGFSVATLAKEVNDLGASFEYTTQYASSLSDGSVSLGEIRDSLLGIRDVAKTPEELSEGFLELVKAGVSASDALKQIETVSKYAAVGELSLKTATEQLVTIQSAFAGSSRGLRDDLLSVADVSDIVAFAAQKSTASFGDMQESFKTLASSASTVGMTIQEAAAASMVMHDKGLKGTYGATALRTAMQKLVNPTKKAAEVFEKFGLDSSKIFSEDGSLKSITSMMEELSRLKGFLTTSEWSELAFTAFGLRGINISPLIDAFAKFSDNLYDLQNAAGFVDKVFSELSDTTKMTAANLEADFKRALIKAFDGEKATEVLGKLRDLVNSSEFQTAIQSMTESIYGLAETSVTLAPSILGLFADIAEGVNILANPFDAYMKYIGKPFEAKLNNTAEAIKFIYNEIVNDGKESSEEVKVTSESMAGYFEAIGESASVAADKYKGFQESLDKEDARAAIDEKRLNDALEKVRLRVQAEEQFEAKTKEIWDRISANEQTGFEKAKGLIEAKLAADIAALDKTMEHEAKTITDSVKLNELKTERIKALQAEAAQAISEAGDKQAEKDQAALDKLTSATEKFYSSLETLKNKAEIADSTGIDKIQAKINAEVAAKEAALKKEIKAMEDAGATKQSLLDAEKAAVEEVAAFREAKAEEAKQKEIKAAEEKAKKIKELQDEVTDYLDSRRMDETEYALAQLEKEYQAKVTAAEDDKKLLADLVDWKKEKIKEIEEVNDEVTKAVAEMWDALGTNMSDAIYDVLSTDFNDLSESWDSFCDGMEDSFNRAVSNVISSWMESGIQSMFESDSGGDSGDGIWDAVVGVWDSIWSADGGLINDHERVRSYASGGKVYGGSGKVDDIYAGSLADGTRVMVTGGEYIMPVKETQENFGMLEAMRAGKIKGFATGGINSEGLTDNSWGAAFSEAMSEYSLSRFITGYDAKFQLSDLGKWLSIPLGLLVTAVDLFRITYDKRQDLTEQREEDIANALVDIGPKLDQELGEFFTDMTEALDPKATSTDISSMAASIDEAVNAGLEAQTEQFNMAIDASINSAIAAQEAFDTQLTNSIYAMRIGQHSEAQANYGSFALPGSSDSNEHYFGIGSSWYSNMYGDVGDDEGTPADNATTGDSHESDDVHFDGGVIKSVYTSDYLPDTGPDDGYAKISLGEGVLSNETMDILQDQIKNGGLGGNVVVKVYLGDKEMKKLVDDVIVTKNRQGTSGRSYI